MSFSLRLPSRPMALSTVCAALLSLGAACDAGDGGESTAGSTGGMASPCEGDMRGDDYAVGLAKTSDPWTVTFVDASPAPPVKGDNTWTLQVTNADGTPQPGMILEVGTWMPDHGHGSPVVPTVTELADSPGTYEIDPLNFFMAGLWEITLTLRPSGGDVASDVVFRFCIDP